MQLQEERAITAEHDLENARAQVRLSLSGLFPSLSGLCPGLSGLCPGLPKMLVLFCFQCSSPLMS